MQKWLIIFLKVANFIYNLFRKKPEMPAIQKMAEREIIVDEVPEPVEYVNLCMNKMYIPAPYPIKVGDIVKYEPIEGGFKVFMKQNKREVTYNFSFVEFGKYFEPVFKGFTY